MHLLPFHEQLKHWAMEDNMRGFDCLGADPVVTIPTAGANYTDAKTVASVQTALNTKGYGPLVVDGLFGPKTKTAIQRMQKDAGLDPSGKIDEGVIMALKVTPGVLPPGVTIQGKAAVQAQVALDAATLAEHAGTTGELQKAAQDALDAANAAQPPLSPEVRQAAMDSLNKARQATTPAQVQMVKQQVQQTAQTVANQVAPNWWKQPAWPGGYERWKVAAVGSGTVVGLGGLFAWLVSSATRTVR
jgi:peptidoglycan hydrolase-like protein with peptidoglycan-binding domain